MREGESIMKMKTCKVKKKIPLRLNNLRKISKCSFSDQFCNFYLNWNNFPKTEPKTFGPVNKIFLNQE